MLSSLRGLLQRQGVLSGLIIDETDGLPSSSAYRSRFGRLLRAYGLVGFTPRRDYRYIAINQALRRMHPDVETAVVQGLSEVGLSICPTSFSGLVEVNAEFSLSVIIARCQRKPANSLRWRLRFETGLRPDITVAVRIDPGNQKPFDYYLLPHIDIACARLDLAENNRLKLDVPHLFLGIVHLLSRSSFLNSPGSENAVQVRVSATSVQPKILASNIATQFTATRESWPLREAVPE